MEKLVLPPDILRMVEDEVWADLSTQVEQNSISEDEAIRRFIGWRACYIALSNENGLDS